MAKEGMNYLKSRISGYKPVDGIVTGSYKGVNSDLMAWGLSDGNVRFVNMENRKKYEL